ncbi:MAG TPA: Ldh family oxidoreductase [Anaerolineae bacterium]|nr:Ldh family oxidoreductase [Anaerolineae bacterium]
MDETAHVPVDVVRRFVVEVLQRAGTPPEDAAICADVLLTADLRGIESHGVGRLKYYYDRIRAGVQHTTTEIEVIRESETTVVLDGHHGMGHVIAHRAMRMAIDKARAYGLGAVAVRNSTHYGIAGYYPLMAAREGMMGFCVTNARPAITPTFGTEPMLGTNPIAFAAPSDTGFPFCFDGATSISQRGKIEVAARAGTPVPEGWLIDPQGKFVTDPDVILENLGKAEAAFLPLGGAGELYAGYKGYGLATMVEILSASLSGGVFLKDLLGFAPDGSRRPFMLGHFFLAIDIAHFVPVEVSRHVTGGIIQALQASRKAPGEERIFAAGEKEHESEQRVRLHGIPVNEGLRQELRWLSDELSIPGYEEYF